MKTAIDVIDRIYEILHSNGLSNINKINYKDNGAIDGMFVINSVNITGYWYKSGVINVNCYKSDIQSGIPDYVNLNTNAKLVKDILDGYQSNDLIIGHASERIFREKELSMHYINLRYDLNFAEK